MANIFTDSIFSIDPGHRAEKVQIAKTMRKSFDNEIGTAIKLLMEYDNLVEHDDLDC